MRNAIIRWTSGRHMHELKLIQNKEYLRKRIGVKEKLLDQYLAGDLIRGVVDEVLFLEDGTAAPLDYKFAKFEERLYNTYQTQLFCYALLIEANFQVSVNKGYLVYIRSQNKLVEVPIGNEEKEKIKSYANEILKIINENVYPKATKSKKRCVTCTYRNICTR